MKNSIVGPQLTKRLSWISLATFLVASLLLLSRFFDPRAAVRGVAQLAVPASQEADNSTFGRIIEALYKPRLHPIIAENFTDEIGKVFRVPGEPFYKQSLGKRVLILDADTRPMNKEGELLSTDGMKWPKPDPVSSGMLSHYLYCRHNCPFSLQRPDLSFLCCGY